MKKTIKIKGMHCSSCKMLIEDALNDIGVKSKVDNEKGIAVVEFNEQKVSEKKIKEIIKREGYKVG